MLFRPVLPIPSAQPFLPRHPGSQQKPVYLPPPGRRAVRVSYTVQPLSASQLSHLPKAPGSGAVERPHFLLRRDSTFLSLNPGQSDFVLI